MRTVARLAVRTATLVLALSLSVLNIGAATTDDLGDLAGVAVNDHGDVLLSSGREDGSRGALIFVHASRAAIIHRFVPGDTPFDVIATASGFVGWKGFPEGGGGAFAVINGRYVETFDFVNRGYGSLFTVRAVPYEDGLLVGGDGGIGRACRAIHAHSPCGAFYHLDVHGAHTAIAFRTPTNWEILAGDGARAWFRTASGLYVLDGGVARRVTEVVPWEVEPLGGNSVLVAFPAGPEMLGIGTIGPNGVLRTIIRVPFSAALASGEGFIKFVQLNSPARTFFVLVGDQLHRDQARAYRVLPGPPGEVPRIVACHGKWVAVERGAGSICTDERGLVYLYPNGTVQRLATVHLDAPFRAIGMSDGTIWVAVAHDPPIPTYDSTKPYAQLRRNADFLVHFRPGQAPQIVHLPQ